ncbi:MAG: oligosaccharide flippase family protein [Clostridium celatum]|nr:oligosaccharide flippase family protein [Clostridium celatum]
MKIISLNSMSKPVKATIAFIIASILQQSINLITTPIFTRILSEADYGITNVYQAWFNILNIIITLNLTYGIYNTVMVEFDDEIDKFTSSIISLITLTTFIGYIIYLVFKDKIVAIVGLPNILINIMFINILFSSSTGFWMAKQRFDYKYKLPMIVAVTNTFGTAILSYFFVINMNNDKAIGKIIGASICTITIGVVLYAYLFIKGKVLFNKRYWKYAIIFGLPLVPHYLSGVILAQSDRIIIANIVGNTEAGLYGVAYSASSVITIFWSAINSSWIPWTYKNLSNKNYKKIGDMTNSIIILCSVICIIFTVFAPEIIKVLAAPSYYEAIWAMPPIILGIYFTFVYGLFANIEFYLKKTKQIMLASIVAAIINIILNIIFIPLFGYIAAAYTTLIGYIGLSIMHYIFMKKVEKNKIYDIKFITMISLVLIILSFIIMVLYKYIIIRYLIIIIIISLVIISKKRILYIMKKLKE